jgi:hypothetical protein
MDAVPRGGESVMLDGETTVVVWSVAWELPEGGEPVAWVAVETEREYRRLLAGPHAEGAGEGQPV